ncbi:hypothetical protein JCGZ_09188 [Jatropha curcas]|uniref:Uncharacterized protein n=1 Tax=Jatropha curcas TaxID=180498 RepID=A0A067KRI2_JATCU|nr:hypothetical protein JCGZ_09188 [Jatropha curcas]
MASSPGGMGGSSPMGVLRAIQARLHDCYDLKRKRNQPDFSCINPDDRNNRKPFLHGEWIRFVKERGLMVADMITLSREEDRKNGKQHYIAIGKKVVIAGDDEIQTNGDSTAIFSAETDYFSYNTDMKQKVTKQMFAIANFIIDASDIVFDQLSSNKASVFLPIGMGMSYGGLFICILELMTSEKPTWER